MMTARMYLMFELNQFGAKPSYRCTLKDLMLIPNKQKRLLTPFDRIMRSIPWACLPTYPTLSAKFDTLCVASSLKSAIFQACFPNANLKEICRSSHWALVWHVNILRRQSLHWLCSSWALVQIQDVFALTDLRTHNVVDSTWIMCELQMLWLSHWMHLRFAMFVTLIGTDFLLLLLLFYLFIK